MKKKITKDLIVQSQWKYIRDITITLIIIIALYALGIIFRQQILEFMLGIPVLREITQLIISEIERKSIIGLSLVTFIGSLFFVGYPGDLLYLVYVRAGYGIMYVSLIMLIWMVIAQAINYWCGLLIEKKFLDKFIKDQKKDFRSSIKRYDALFIIIVNLLPLPADILAVFLGMIRYDFKKAMIYTIIGRILKFILNAILMVLFKDISIAFFH